MKLEKIQKKLLLPSQYITWGLWRWKVLPAKVINLLKTNNISYRQPQNSTNNDEELTFNLTKSISPCTEGGFSIFLSSNKLIELEKISNLVPILGEMQYNENLDIISIVDSTSSRSDIFRDGSLIIREKKDDKINHKALSYVKTLYRVTCCDKCSICIYNCSEEALSLIDDGIKVDPQKCVHCLICNDFCPIIKYEKSSKFINNV